MEILTVCFLGLVLGSFSSALAWRIPRGDNWTRARSACPQCGMVLGVRDLIPLLSWLFLRGRCRGCKKPIGAVYPLVELAALAACLGVYAVWGWSAASLVIMFTLPFLIALTVIDLRLMILPDQLVLLTGVMALIFMMRENAAAGRGTAELLTTMAGAGTAAFLYAALSFFLARVTALLLRRETLGMGDVKFFAVAGLWLGVSYLPFFLICAGVIGFFFGIFYKIMARQQLFPFGPALIVSLYLSILLKGLGIIPLLS
jgi:prepilin signal peptidase PulO-like enzyme (type II secretory pathway)